MLCCVSFCFRPMLIVLVPLINKHFTIVSTDRISLQACCQWCDVHARQERWETEWCGILICQAVDIVECRICSAATSSVQQSRGVLLFLFHLSTLRNRINMSYFTSNMLSVVRRPRQTRKMGTSGCLPMLHCTGPSSQCQKRIKLCSIMSRPWGYLQEFVDPSVRINELVNSCGEKFIKGK